MFGYIDQFGNKIIKPKFHAASKFNEGLAPARLGGKFGYIGGDGVFKIPQQFDLAFPFKNGIARVYIDKKPYFINKKGAMLFEHNFKQLYDFNNSNFTQVMAHLGKFGIINKKGDLIIDTIYVSTKSFTKNTFLVWFQKNNNSAPVDPWSTKPDCGILDSLGNWVVPLRKYKVIDELVNGYAKVEHYDEDNNQSYKKIGVINAQGEYMFTVPKEKWSLDYKYGFFVEGKALVNIYSTPKDTLGIKKLYSPETYVGFINPNGEVILSNPEWVSVSYFFGNRAFAKYTDGYWYLIDENGKKVSSTPFLQALPPKLSPRKKSTSSKYLFVKTKEGWIAIDHNGNSLSSPIPVKDEGYYVSNWSDNIFGISTTKDNYHLVGFANPMAQVYIEPKYLFISIDDYEHRVLYAIDKNYLLYLSNYGKVIWSFPLNNLTPRLNINYKISRSGYYKTDTKNTWPVLNNNGSVIQANGPKFGSINLNYHANKIQLFIDKTQLTKRRSGQNLILDNHEAYKLFIVNTTQDTLYFPTLEKNIHLIVQAKDLKGNWQDIEYESNNICGVGFAKIGLAPNNLWEFAFPVYYGSFKTKFRAKIEYMTSLKKDEMTTIYSNEVDGSINPTQFWYDNDTDWFYANYNE